MRTSLLITAILSVFCFSGCEKVAESAKDVVDTAGSAADAAVEKAGDTVELVAGDDAGDQVKDQGKGAVETGTENAKDAIDEAAGTDEE